MNGGGRAGSFNVIRAMKPGHAGDAMGADGERRRHGPGDEVPGDPAQAGDHRRRLRRGPAGLGIGLAGARVLDPKTAALVRVGALAAIGSSAICLEWSTTRALAAGATEDEITDVLLAIAPVAGLGRVISAVPGVADAFGYDIEAALEDPDGH